VATNSASATNYKLGLAINLALAKYFNNFCFARIIKDEQVQVIMGTWKVL
jgi:hypothetical protein